MDNIIEKVASWVADADNEEKQSFFMKYDIFERVLTGKQFIVVGRKGTGKTALGRHICSEKQGFLINFDQFQFKDILAFKDNEYNNDYQYKSIWEYMFLVSVMEKLYDDGLLEKCDDKQAKRILNKRGIEKVGNNQYTIKKLNVLAKFVSQFVTIESQADISIGDGASLSSQNMSRNVEAVKDFIEKYLDTKQYYIVIDNIDGDSSARNTFKTMFFVAIKSLFRAARDINRYFGGKIIIIILLREDIYGAMEETDKWEDAIDRINWNRIRIETLISKKLSHDIGVQNLSFSDICEKLFSDEQLRIGSGRYTLPDHIFRYSQMRPRDVIAHFMLAAREARADGLVKITSPILKRVIPIYSNFMTDGIKKELKTIYDNVDIIFESLSRLDKTTFDYIEFSKIYKQIAKCDESDAMNVSRDLYKFGVIGNQLGPEGNSFIWDDASSTINFKRKFCIHHSVLRSLKQ